LLSAGFSIESKETSKNVYQDAQIEYITIVAMDFGSQLENYFIRKTEVCRNIPKENIGKLIYSIVRTKSVGGRVFTAGNGGSASTAEHFAADLGVGSFNRSAGSHIDVVSLSSNLSVITACANDINFGEVFSRQLLVHSPSEKDLLIVFTASGNSENIVNVMRVARRHSLEICAFTGFDGGVAAELADIPIHLESMIGEYGIIEDIHLSICHAITQILRNHFQVR